MTAFRSLAHGLDDAIRRARAAVAEQRRLAPLRAQRVADLQIALAQVDVCTEVLAARDRDVARERHGGWALVAGLFVDRQSQIAQEEIEARASAAELATAQASVVALEAEVARLDAQLAALGDAAAALHAARQAKLEALVAEDDPVAAELVAVLGVIADAEAELQRITERQQDTATHEDSVTALIAQLDAAVASLGSDDPQGISARMAAIRGQLAEITPGLRVLERALADVGVAFDAPYIGFEAQLVSVGLENACAASGRLAAALGTAAFALRERYGEVARRRDELCAQRDAYLAPDADLSA